MTEIESLIFNRANELSPTISTTWVKKNLLGWNDVEILDDLNQQREERQKEYHENIIKRRVLDDYDLYNKELLDFLHHC